MRGLISVARVAIFSALTFFLSGQASAVSSLELVYLGGGTGNTCINGTSATPGHPGLGSGDCVMATAGDTIRFAIAANVDSLGLVQYSFDLRWDTDGENELDLLQHRERSSLTLISDPSPPPATLAFSVAPLVGSQESSGIGEGHIHGYNATSTSVVPPFPANISFRVGVVAFHVTGNLNRNAGPDIELGFFREGAIFGDANLNAITPNFGSFAIDQNIVPEPSTILLVSAGAVALALFRKRAPKS